MTQYLLRIEKSFCNLGAHFTGCLQFLWLWVLDASSHTYKHNPEDAAYLCETDVSKCVWQQRWCFWEYIFPVVPLLTHTCTQVHRVSQRNPTDVSYLWETDLSKCVCQQTWCFWTHSFPVVPLLDHTCTQFDRVSQRNPTDVVYLYETDVSKYVWEKEWHNPVYASRVDSSAFSFWVFHHTDPRISVFKCPEVCRDRVLCMYPSPSFYVLNFSPRLGIHIVRWCRRDGCYFFSPLCYICSPMSIISGSHYHTSQKNKNFCFSFLLRFLLFGCFGTGGRRRAGEVVPANSHRNHKEQWQGAALGLLLRCSLVPLWHSRCWYTSRLMRPRPRSCRSSRMRAKTYTLMRPRLRTKRYPKRYDLACTEQNSTGVIRYHSARLLSFARYAHFRI